MMNNDYENRRHAILASHKKSLQEQDSVRNKNAEQMFNTKENLVSRIAEEVFPGLAVLELANGRVGMGFFRHETWLVSNAHVVHNNSEVEEGIILKQYEKPESFLRVEKGYHRPWESVISPDIVVLNTQNSHKNIPTNPFSSDKTHKGKHYFYVDAGFQIHFLSLISNPDETPIRFHCEDGSEPEFGCSGSPVFSAEVIIGKTPKWKFENICAVYARFKDALLPQYVLCGMPIVQEFDQIRAVLISIDSATRHQQESIESASLENRQQEHLSRIAAEHDMAIAAANIQIFTAGHSALNIALPDGLERLAKNTYAKLAESYLQSIKNLSLDDVHQSFSQFIDLIKQQQSICIAYKKDTPVLETAHWRLDCKPGSQGKFRLLQLQDNTGKGAVVPGTEKSASSIFAQVKIMKDVDSINGEPLAEDLLASHIAIESNQSEQEISIIVDFSIMDPIRRKKYELIDRRPASPALTLFHAIPIASINGHHVIQQSINNGEVERINSTNAEGDTPLMALLKKPLKDAGQRAKAKLLASYSIWNQPNDQGKTARKLLEEHTDTEELTRVFDLSL